MALLNRKVDYAILVVSYLHDHPGGGCAREIAARFGLSRAFVANILKELGHKGFVTSQRGSKGGYTLQRPAVAVSVADFLEALDEPFQLTACTGPAAGDGCALLAVCPVRLPITEIHRRIREVLRGVTLADLFRPAPPEAVPLAGGVALPMREMFAPPLSS